MGLGKPKRLAKFKVASFSHYRNIKRGPKMLGNSHHPKLRTLFWCDFMMCLRTFQLHAKFEVASFSICRNSTGELHMLRSSPDQGQARFSSGWDLLMGLGKSQLLAKSVVASFIRCKNIKGNPKNLGSSPSPGSCLLFFRVGFYDEFWQTPTACHIWSHWLHLLYYYENITEFALKVAIKQNLEPLF